MAQGGITDDELAQLIRRTEEAASALMRGDMATYVTLTRHSRDFTLMQPSGGGPVRHENRAEDLAGSADFFRGGDARLEDVHAFASGDLVVLAMVERQHGEVGGLPNQDCSLRVTLAFRREGSEWRLLYRHADPLVRPVTLQQVAALSRGQPA